MHRFSVHLWWHTSHSPNPICNTWWQLAWTFKFEHNLQSFTCSIISGILALLILFETTLTHTNYKRIKMCFKVVFVSLIAIVEAECIDFFANQQNDDMFNPSQAKRDLGPRQFSLKSDWQLTAIFRFHGHHHAGHWQPHWSMLLHSMSSKFGKCGDRIPAIWFYHSKNKDENKLHVNCGRLSNCFW